MYAQRVLVCKHFWMMVTWPVERLVSPVFFGGVKTPFN